MNDQLLMLANAPRPLKRIMDQLTSKFSPLSGLWNITVTTSLDHLFNLSLTTNHFENYSTPRNLLDPLPITECASRCMISTLSSDLAVFTKMPMPFPELPTDLPQDTRILWNDFPSKDRSCQISDGPRPLLWNCQVFVNRQNP